MTEQSFSQFALSGGANVFDAKGNVDIDTPEMAKALAFYKALAATTMPGSNDVMEIKDAFMNGSAPMAVYSTYILPAVYKDGNPANLGFVVPTENSSAVYGMITSLTITTGQTEEETKAPEVCYLDGAGSKRDGLGHDVAGRGAAGKQGWWARIPGKTTT
jgi:multiple sugar transport system substrate-binding protein